MTEAAVRMVLESAAHCPAGSSIVLAFASRDTGRASEAAERAALHGEPWLTYFTTAEVERLLLQSGFSSVEFLLPETAARLYYAGRSDLPAPRKTRLCMATV